MMRKKSIFWISDPSVIEDVLKRQWHAHLKHCGLETRFYYTPENCEDSAVYYITESGGKITLWVQKEEAETVYSLELISLSERNYIIEYTDKQLVFKERKDYIAAYYSVDENIEINCYTMQYLELTSYKIEIIYDEETQDKAKRIADSLKRPDMVYA